MKTPKNRKSLVEKSDENDKTKSESAKKLVQTRLPFKVISTTLSDDTPAPQEQLKKRKLSDKDYEEASPSTAHKEEQNEEDTEEMEATSENDRKKIKLHPEEMVIVVLTDDENDEEIKIKKTPLIKLPFVNKKGRRRKSAVKNLHTASSDEADKQESTLHPKKRPKVDVDEKDPEKNEASTEKEESEIEKCNKVVNEENEIQQTNEKDDGINEVNSFIKYDQKENQNDDHKVEQQIINSDEKDEEKKEPETDETDEKIQKQEKEENFKNIETEKVAENHKSDSSDCNSDGSLDEKETTLDISTCEAQKIDGDEGTPSVQNQTKKPLTKKQLELMERRREAREEKERKAMEEKLQKQKEKEEREEVKKREKEEKEEQKRKEREEKEEKKRQEREEKERKRLAEIEAKNEEKRKRTEAKEEERKRKDLEKEEAELKAKKRAEAFTKFFVPKAESNEQQEQIEQENLSQTIFRPFQIKGAMKLAPVKRRELSEDERQFFEQILQNEELKENLYLSQLKKGKHTPIKCLKSVANELKETSSEAGDDNDVCFVGKNN